MDDMLWDGLTDSYVNLPMGMTAENLADKYGISRQECDEYALQTQTRWQEGMEHLLPLFVIKSYCPFVEGNVESLHFPFLTILCWEYFPS